jgi:hypothetical protein
MSETASNLTQEAAERTRSAADTISSSAARARDKAGDMAETVAGSVKHSASTAYDTIADGARRTTAAVTDTSKTIGRRTLATSNDFLKLCQDQPLMIVGIGVALGAAVGALLPSTDTEDQLMGETSDAVKDQVQDAASKEYEKVKAAGSAALGGHEQDSRGLKLDGSSEGGSTQEAGEEASLVPSASAENRPDHASASGDGQAWEENPLERSNVSR